MLARSISCRVADQCKAARTSCSIAPGSAPEAQAVTLQQINMIKSRKQCILQVDSVIALRPSVVGSTEGPLDFGEVGISDLLGHIVQ
jgi:hypothetical protein